MRRHAKLWGLLLGGACLLACQPDPQTTPSAESAVEPMSGGPTPATSATRGVVVETMNSGGYTYARVDLGSDVIWAAAPEVEVEVGDTVSMPQGIPMANYHSDTLHRSFDMVYFVAYVRPEEEGSGSLGSVPGDATGSLPAGHPPATGTSAAAAEPAPIDFSGVRPAEGGKTVAQVFAEKGALTGQEVAVRGKVVKFNAAIMGKNWLHVRDGTGDEGSNDLLVTTSETVRVGDTVLVRGVLATDVDFGFGYQYDVILQEANVSIE